MKALLCSILAFALLFSLGGCTSCSNTSSSSSMSSSLASSMYEEPSSSMSSSTSSSFTSDLMSGVESTVSDVASAVESAVTPTMGTDFDKIGALSEETVKWGPGARVDPESNRTLDCVDLQEKYGDLGAYFIAPEGSDKLYLTFDEGYENGYSPAILDVLNEKGVSAVFFVTGDFVRSQPALVQRMIDEGHVLGNHTDRHKILGGNVNTEGAVEDIRALHELVREQFGYEMYLYRPPQGLFSEKSLAAVRQMGYTTVLWSFAYADWKPDKQMGYDDALAKTTQMIHDGGLYLLHAVSKDNSEILGALIDEIEARGLQISKWDLP